MPHQRVPSSAYLLVPLLGNCLAAAVWFPLLRVPEGTVIRPMLESSLTGLVALATAAVGVPLGLAMQTKGRRISGLLCIITSVTPFVVGTVTAHWISDMRQLTWAP